MRMEKIAELVRAEVGGLAPYLKVTATDGVCSCIHVTGSFDRPSTWPGAIFENSRYFRFMITSSDRYYEEGDKISIELISGWKVPKFRRYSSINASQIARKLKDWFVQANDEFTQR